MMLDPSYLNKPMHISASFLHYFLISCMGRRGSDSGIEPDAALPSRQANEWLGIPVVAVATQAKALAWGFGFALSKDKTSIENKKIESAREYPWTNDREVEAKTDWLRQEPHLVSVV